MKIAACAAFAFLLAACGVGLGQVPLQVRGQGFTYQLPAIRAELDYPPELADVEVGFDGTIQVWLSPSSTSDEVVQIPEKQVPPQTRGYARQVFWNAVTSDPHVYGYTGPKDLAGIASRYRVTVRAKPLVNRLGHSVPALWSYLVRVVRLDEARRPVWSPTLIKLLLLDEDGRILFGSGQRPFDWAIGRAEVSNGVVTVDIFTDGWARPAGLSGEALLTRYVYSKNKGTLMPASLAPFRVNIMWYWDPQYKDRQ